MTDDPPKKDDRTWETADGRTIPLDDMSAPHIQLASAKLGRWLKGENDPVVRRDLSRWRGKFRKELRERQKEWMERRDASKRD